MPSTWCFPTCHRLLAVLENFNATVDRANLSVIATPERPQWHVKLPCTCVTWTFANPLCWSIIFWMSRDGEYGVKMYREESFRRENGKIRRQSHHNLFSKMPKYLSVISYVTVFNPRAWFLILVLSCFLANTLVVCILMVSWHSKHWRICKTSFSFVCLFVFFADVKAKVGSSPFIKCHTQFTLILWHPYAHHHYFCVATEKEQQKWLAVLQDCVRHTSDGDFDFCRLFLCSASQSFYIQVAKTITFLAFWQLLQPWPVGPEHLMATCWILYSLTQSGLKLKHGIRRLLLQ